MDESAVKIEVDLDLSKRSPNAQTRIWRISHGGIGEMTDNDHQLLLANNLVCIGYPDPKDDKRKQRKTFVENIKEGDYFYLLRRSHIVLWGKFIGSHTSSPPEGFSKKSWLARKIEKIKEANHPNKELIGKNLKKKR